MQEVKYSEQHAEDSAVKHSVLSLQGPGLSPGDKWAFTSSKDLPWASGDCAAGSVPGTASETETRIYLKPLMEKAIGDISNTFWRGFPGFLLQASP